MKNPPAKPWRVPLIVSLVIVVLFALGWWLFRDLYMPVLMPSGQVADQQRTLFVFTVALSVVVVVPVFALLVIFAWRYRDTGEKAPKNYRPEWGENKWLEITWWGIPIVIIAVLSVVTYLTSHSLDPYRAIESDKETLEVQVVALQWKWLFIYPELGVATVNDLTIPVDTPVHFSLSADAPMSAFWVPALGSQIYSMNSMSSQLNLMANETGTFKGYNTNINGEGYAKMTFDVNSVSDDEFDDWQSSHASSGHRLDWQHYGELAEPSTMSSPMYMSLADDKLYQRIVMKNMTMNEDSRASMESMSGETHEGMAH